MAGIVDTIARAFGIRTAPLPVPRSRSSGFTPIFKRGGLNVAPLTTHTEQTASYKGWVYAAVSTIAADMRTNDWGLYKKVGKHRDDWEELSEDNEFADFLNAPNNSDTWGDFLETASIQLDLTGEVYIHLISSGKRIVGLEVIYTEWVDDRVVENGKHVGWKVTVPGYTQKIMSKDEVVQLKYPHPKEPFRGASPVEAFALSYNLDLYAKAYGSNLMQNRAIPDVIISTEQEITPEQADIIRERYKDRHLNRPGEPAVFGQGSKIQIVSQTLQDLAFIEVAGLTREQILAIYKVPPSKLGISGDVNKASAREVNRSYNENALLPRLRRFEEILNLKILPLVFGVKWRSMYFEFRSPVDEDEVVILRRANDAFDRGTITFNEYRRETGRNPTPKGDLFSMPNAKQITVGIAPTPAAPQPVGKPPQPSNDTGGNPEDSPPKPANNNPSTQPPVKANFEDLEAALELIASQRSELEELRLKTELEPIRRNFVNLGRAYWSKRAKEAKTGESDTLLLAYDWGTLILKQIEEISSRKGLIISDKTTNVLQLCMEETENWLNSRSNTISERCEEAKSAVVEATATLVLSELLAGGELALV